MGAAWERHGMCELALKGFAPNVYLPIYVQVFKAIISAEICHVKQCR
jgi:hypothetical protein